MKLAAERRIRALAIHLRELADDLNAGRPVVAQLDRTAAELASELDAYNELGELRLDDEEEPRVAFEGAN